MTNKKSIKCPHCGKHFIQETTIMNPNFNFKNSLIELGVDIDIAEDWMKVRKTKRATNTRTALKSIIKQIKLSGKSANECIALAVEESWSGFKAKWLINLKYERNRTNNSKGFESDTTRQTIEHINNGFK